MHPEKPSNDFHGQIFEKKKKIHKTLCLARISLFQKKKGLPAPSHSHNPLPR